MVSKKGARMKRNLCALLAGCLLFGTLWGCRNKEKEELPDSTPTPTAGSQTIVDVPKEDDLPETKNEMVNGEEVTMTLVSGSFARLGGPDFSLYVEKERYTVNDVEGCCYLTDDAGTTYAEIGFRENSTAETLSGTFLREYGNMQENSDDGNQDFGDYTARKLGGYTMDSSFEAFLIDVDGGCVTLVVCSPLGDASPDSAVMSEAARLIQSLQTITLS